MSRSTSLSAILALYFLPGTLSRPVAGQQAPTLHSTVRQVLVPVVVTDAKGHYVTDLKAIEFRVFEDGAPEKIVAFSAATDAAASSRQRPVSAAGTHPQQIRGVVATEAPPRRTYLVCVDILHSAYSNLSRVRAALGKFFEQEQSADSQYVLVALGRQARVVQDSTRDPAVVLAAINSKNLFKTILDSEAANVSKDAQQFTKLVADYCHKCACGGNVEFPGCSAARSRVQGFLLSSGERTAILNQNFLQSLTEVVKATAEMPTSRQIIFISDGFNRYPGRELYAILEAAAPKDRSFEFNPRDDEELLQKILKLAIRYDVKFYTLDSRGLYSAASVAGNSFDASNGGGHEEIDRNEMTVAHENTDALAQLAHETGGLFFENSDDLLKGIRRSFVDGRQSYMLAYAPVNTDLNGKFRKIRVEVKGKKLQVRAKSGYWATGN